MFRSKAWRIEACGQKGGADEERSKEEKQVKHIGLRKQGPRRMSSARQVSYNAVSINTFHCTGCA